MRIDQEQINNEIVWMKPFTTHFAKCWSRKFIMFPFFEIMNEDMLLGKTKQIIFFRKLIKPKFHLSNGDSYGAEYWKLLEIYVKFLLITKHLGYFLRWLSLIFSILFILIFYLPSKISTLNWLSFCKFLLSVFNFTLYFSSFSFFF